MILESAEGGSLTHHGCLTLKELKEFDLKVSVNGAPGAIPTRDLPLRRRTLYATELREHVSVHPVR